MSKVEIEEKKINNFEKSIKEKGIDHGDNALALKKKKKTIIKFALIGAIILTTLLLLINSFISYTY